MRRLCVLVGVVILSGCGSEVAQPDPCKVLSSDEVSRVIEGPSGKPVHTGTGEGCSFGNLKHAGATTLILNVVPKDTAARFGHDRDVAAKTAPVSKASAGDESFTYGHGETQSAEARSGSVRVRVLLDGPKATTTKATEALRLAVARL